MHKRIFVMSISFILFTLILTGCLFKGEQSLEDMDAPPNVQFTDDLDGVGKEATGQIDGEENQNEKDVDSEDQTEDGNTVKRELFLLDENGMVVPQTISLPATETKEVAKQVLEYLVIDGPVTNLLPNGFKAVLPAGTQVNSLSLEDGVLTVDLSEEFTQYAAEDELKIIQAMTFTLTQFDSVERIKLRMDGKDLDVMPVNGTPIANGYSRADGINVYVGDVSDITEAKATTVYFPAQHDDNFYYVPVTMPLNLQDQDIYTAVVEQLINGPSYELSGLLSVFQNDVRLLSTPSLEEGTLTLTFNDSILNNLENKTISNEVLNSLVLSLTEQESVESVLVKVEGVEQVYNEDGEIFSEPVSREEVIEASGI
jgi:germination protein M